MECEDGLNHSFRTYIVSVTKASGPGLLAQFLNASVRSTNKVFLSNIAQRYDARKCTGSVIKLNKELMCKKQCYI